MNTFAHIIMRFSLPLLSMSQEKPPQLGDSGGDFGLLIWVLLRANCWHWVEYIFSISIPTSMRP